MVLATIVVTLPFVVREVEPVLREIGVEQEAAAATLGASAWQTLLRIALPAIRWGLGYAVILTVPRSLGEFGAVIMVSSNQPGSRSHSPCWSTDAISRATSTAPTPRRRC